MSKQHHRAVSTGLLLLYKSYTKYKKDRADRKNKTYTNNYKKHRENRTIKTYTNNGQCLICHLSSQQIRPVTGQCVRLSFSTHAGAQRRAVCLRQLRFLLRLLCKTARIAVVYFVIHDLNSNIAILRELLSRLKIGHQISPASVLELRRP